MLTESDSQELLNLFPDVDFAFAYGSGAFKQSGYKYDYEKSKNVFPMFDVIFVVEDSCDWHAKNKKMNPSHYTSIIPLNSSIISYIQDNFGANLWFNVYIKIHMTKYPQRQIKYGVVNKENFLKDINEWSNLYIAGRLHKPVYIMKSNEQIENSIAINHNH
jgi:translocator assembly and maintenance protein 41